MLSCVRPAWLLQLLLLIVLEVALAAPAPPQPPPLVDTLAQELDRNFKILKEKGDPAPYFISYSVYDEESKGLSATLGAVQSKGESHRRMLDCSVRVGSYELDNYHLLDGDRPRFASAAPLPVEDYPAAIARTAWQQTDDAWRAASQRYAKVLNSVQVKSGIESADKKDKPVADFSHQQPVQATETVPRPKFSADDWAPRLRKLSLAFAQYPGILNSSIEVTWRRVVVTFVDTEGTRIQHGRNFANVSIVARAKTYDGQDLLTMENLEVDDPAHLPKDDVLSAAVARVGGDLVKLTRSQPSDPYVGPAVLSGRAAAVFFHEIFGHRVEGHRQNDESEGQTFSNSVGKPVLPQFLSVTFDATKRTYGSTDLNGWYSFDDQGVPSRPLPVVVNGVLTNFLMSRTPIRGFPQSNGHGRRAPGYEVVSRQSNMFVESSKRVSDAELRKMLIAEVVRQGKPYGLYFEQVTGGYTTTRRTGLQAFTVIPLVVYRVYPDGRPDELIRGADIVGTPLTSFSKILATSDRSEVFNGYCGAESGSVPVAAVAPALLVSEIEIQRKPENKDMPPILPRPAPEARQ